ncbi:hypothetical protein BpHYR1_007881 [Brachionus plicatilis]|uniref:Uncharacterized protein n=1 Tax=Brachionus plicatilis TaxID=10195 RepID=A0A3M7S5L1_BRAPC|nr:hypothetical protein BpHYR1_007881 [Brachionus plicatilis]
MKKLYFFYKNIQQKPEITNITPYCLTKAPLAFDLRPTLAFCSIATLLNLFMKHRYKTFY